MHTHTHAYTFTFVHVIVVVGQVTMVDHAKWRSQMTTELASLLSQQNCSLHLSH